MAGLGTPAGVVPHRAAEGERRRQATQGGARPQRGGTLLGIILGVVAGLAVALGVAIYVAKVPVPFVNKNTSRTSGQDAAEAEKNRDWDPNAPLRSRNGVRPASPGNASSGSVAPAPEPAPIPAPAEVARPAQRPADAKPADSKPAQAKASEPRGAEVKPPAVAGRPPPPRASADPLGDLATARAGAATAPAAPAAPAADPFTYFVQAGAFRTSEDADAQRARLQLMGVEARVTEREQAGRTVYRVRVGPFQNKDAADRVKDRLDGSGFDSALVRVQR